MTPSTSDPLDRSDPIDVNDLPPHHGPPERLPRDARAKDGDCGEVRPCPYSPRSFRATSSTLLLGAGVDIRKVQQLLGHRHITTIQIYGKRRIAAAQGASHDIPI